MIELRCPICRERLEKADKSLRCKNLHSFDISSDGYVNLGCNKGGSGDDRMMCRARRDFLRKDYYRPFASELAKTVRSLFPDSVSILDAGCGEGYYLRAAAGMYGDDKFLGLGIDLAKDSVRFASKLLKTETHDIFYAVCGIFDMPVFDCSFDCVLSVFAPIPEKEAARVLKEKGKLIVCHPGADHLDGMKSAIYESTYKNDETAKELSLFKHISDTRCRYSSHIEKEDLSNLLAMTPYYWKTSKADAEKYLSLDFVDTNLDFIISVYEKI